MVSDNKGKVHKPNSLRKILSMLSACIDTEEVEGATVYMPEVGQVPVELYSDGVEDLEPEVASAITSMYLLSENYDKGVQLPRPDVDGDTFLKVVTGEAIVADLDCTKPIYDKSNIRQTPEESRAGYAHLVGVALSAITKEQYKALNPKLKEVVDHAIGIVKASIEGKVNGHSI